MNSRLFAIFVIALLAGCTESFDENSNIFQNTELDTVITIGGDSGFSNTQELLNTGELQYNLQCANCHGPVGAGSPGSSILASVQNGTAIHLTETSMPVANPALCDNACSTAITAWVAIANNIPVTIENEDDSSGSASTAADNDGDGIPNVIDLDPNNAAYISEPGIHYERWNMQAASIEYAFAQSFLETNSVVNEPLDGNFEAPENVGDNYIIRMRTVFTPETSGTFHFYSVADDAATVWLSELTDTDNKEKIIEQLAWSPKGNYSKRASQKSEAMELVAGKHYYVEYVGLENGGNDHFSLYLSRVTNGDETTPAMIPMHVLQQFTPEMEAALSGELIIDPSEPITPTVPTIPSVPETPTTPTNPNVPTSGDSDGDGAVDLLDLYPDDASKISDAGYSYQRWENQPFKDNDDVLADNLFAITPDVEELYTGTVDVPTNVSSDFVQRVRLYFKPSITANYRFYVAVDDHAQLRLSMDASPWNATTIVNHHNYTSHNQFNKYPSQASAEITLLAGKYYYLEGFALEGGGGDHFSIAWSNDTDGIVTILDNTEQFYLPDGIDESVLIDTDLDGIFNFEDTDDDNDGTADVLDDFPLNPNEARDTDGDTLGDNADTDDDNDGVSDSQDEFPLDPSKSGSLNDNEATLNKDVLQAKCIACHQENGSAKSSRLIFVTGNTASIIRNNENRLGLYVATSADGDENLLDKARGLRSHGGGAVLPLGTDGFTLLESFVNLLTGKGGDIAEVDENVVLESPDQTYRRASVYLTGQVPSQSKLLDMSTASDARLRLEVLALMEGEGFKSFLKDAANSRLHSRHLRTSDAGVAQYDWYYEGDKNQARYDMAEEPLELIAHVVMNDRPYTEILTADYTMVGSATADMFKTGISVNEGDFKPARNRGQFVKSPETGRKDGIEGDAKINDFPHAGVLSTWAYLSRYPTTATNRNRARAAWTMRHFLGFDVEKTADRVVDVADVIDSDNPTMNNPACTSCHIPMDPVAGAFKFFHETGGYKAYGEDSLDSTYRRSNPGLDSWYHDVRPAGYNGELVPTDEDPLQWLAKQLVEDYRFPSGVVKFWWKPLFGEDVLEEGAQSNQFDAQQILISQLAAGFKQHWNLKDLLADMIVSPAYRAESKKTASIADELITIRGGARHLLTAQQLVNKTQSLTGFVWDENNPKLTNHFSSLMGTPDDINVDDAPEHVTALMMKIAQRQAYRLSCAIVRYDFNSAQSNRLIFTEVERDTLSELALRNQISVMFERFLNVKTSAFSPDVNEVYILLLDLRNNKIARGGNARLYGDNRCDENKAGSSDDDSHILGPWMGILAYMMTSPEYLYE